MGAEMRGVLRIREERMRGWPRGRCKEKSRNASWGMMNIICFRRLH